MADHSVMALVLYIRGYLVVRRRDRHDSRAGLGDTGENALRPCGNVRFYTISTAVSRGEI